MSRNLPKQLQTGLVMWLDSQGKDLSGSGNNGTLVNAPTKVRRLQNDGLTYNGSSSYMDLGLKNWGISTGFTLSAWIKVNNYSGFNGIINKDDGTIAPVNRHFIFRANITTGTLGLIRFDSANNVVSNFNSTNAIGTNWALVNATFDNTVGSKLYINGVVVASDSVLTNNATLANENTYIGARDSGTIQNFMNGQIINPMIHNRTLSTKEIELLYYSLYIK